MACPACGSTEPRREIAPGYFECRNELVELVQTGAHPSGSHGPTSVPVPRPCGQRYQEGSAAARTEATCACGTYAIGRCGECGTAVCGDHSWLVEGARRCRSCIAALKERKDEADRAAAHDRQVALQARLDAERAEVLRFLETNRTHAFDALFIDRSSDKRVRYWSAKALVDLTAPNFTKLAVARYTSRGIRSEVGDDFAGRRRGLTGKVLIAMKSYRFWPMPEGFNAGQLALTTSGRWHAVSTGESYMRGTSYTTHTGAYLPESQAHVRIRAALRGIISGAEGRTAHG